MKMKKIMLMLFLFFPAFILNADDSLWTAALDGKLDVVKSLIKNGDNVNEKDRDGITALRYAAANGHLEVVQYLIEKKANVNLSDNDGSTALITASLNGHLEVVKVLVKNKANVNAKTNNGYTALMFAAIHHHLEVVKFLVENKANVNAKNDNGTTALDLATTMSGKPTETSEFLTHLTKQEDNIIQTDNGQNGKFFPGGISDYFPIKIDSTYKYSTSPLAKPLTQSVKITKVTEFNKYIEMDIESKIDQIEITNIMTYKITKDMVTLVNHINTIYGTDKSIPRNEIILMNPGNNWVVNDIDNIEYSSSKNNIKVDNKLYEDCIMITKKTYVIEKNKKKKYIATETLFYAKGIGLVYDSGKSNDKKSEVITKLTDYKIQKNFAKEEPELDATSNGKWSSYQGSMSWKDATAKCKSLGMRLATIDELKAAHVEGLTKNWLKDHAVYWSSTPCLFSTPGYDYAYYFNINSPNGNDENKDYFSQLHYYSGVRCLR